MPARTNRFKAALKRGELQIGLWASIAEIPVTEICAHAGFDWLTIDGEHGPNDIRSIRDQLIVMEASPAEALVRVLEPSPALIKQVMDVGAQSILAPMVDTAEQADLMVRSVRYAPEGIRGCGPTVARVGGYRRVDDYTQTANEQACLVVQVETEEALGNLGEILAVDGVEGVFIGPADLAGSLGHAGDLHAPAVENAVQDAIVAVRAAGKAPGIITGERSWAERYIELGALFVAVGSDVSVLAGAGAELARSYKT